MSSSVGLNPHRINGRSPEENGDCESLHGHFKDYLDQRLLLRGNRNFESLAKWREFLKDCCDARNKNRSAAAIAQELEQLESLPKEMFPTFTLYESTVKSSCILRVKQNDYAVPSCFIGKRVQLLRLSQIGRKPSCPNGRARLLPSFRRHLARQEPRSPAKT